MAPQLCNKVKDLIAMDYKSGISANLISIKYKISRKTAQNWIKKIINGEKFTRKVGSGRKSLIGEEEKELIIKLHKNDPFISLKRICLELKKWRGIVVSKSTVSRFFKKINIFTYNAAKKPMLSKKNINLRKRLSSEFLEMTLEDTDNIIFSDECKFNLYTSDGKTYVRRKKGDRLKLKNIRPTVKFGGGNIMVWACISSKGTGNLVFIEDTMNAIGYRTILVNNLIKSAKKMKLKNFYFMHDNDPKHTSRLVKEYLAKKRIKLLEWPPQSPDMNPIEQVWAFIKRELSKYGKMNKNDLKIKIMEIWKSLTPEFIKNYTRSFNKRCKAVYDANGKHTNY